METFPLSAAYIVVGLHLTENLQHHKRADVRRILEEKGFSEIANALPDHMFHFFIQEGQTSSSKRTIIIFGDKDTVHPTEGVRFYDNPDSADK